MIQGILTFKPPPLKLPNTLRINEEERPLEDDDADRDECVDG
jgi:hypothetical protein